YTKSCATKYCEFLEGQKEKVFDLSSFAIAQAFKNQLDGCAASSSTRNFATLLDEFFENNVVKSFSINSSINTESNLSSVVLEKIYNSFGMDFSIYTPLDKTFIDDSILGTRNMIAHGENHRVTLTEFIERCSTMETLIDKIYTDFSNHVILKKHKKHPKRKFQ
ncbi:MAG: MAE_28990/MAE_18760 family HEPN-like nuclease, partial [Bacteroidota bacterium]